MLFLVVSSAGLVLLKRRRSVHRAEAALLRTSVSITTTCSSKSRATSMRSTHV
ncbi:hypothetical protein PR002_g9045 [Phytophthora rubi]|uniref:Uncharacterized protein n=1 Tax=Phytophthora rubi TaxID=129364 RepID=A0A6A3MM88_9STRA|nr:hypothetical protein PR002_g9045 [Phytophthora rubi]